MRNLTRFLAMALTILMIAGCFSVAALAYADGPFVNYDDEIAVLSDMGLFKGYAGTNEFGYGNNITRREACILFARVLTGRTDAEYAAANFMGAANDTIFADLDATGDYYGAINLAVNENLIIGYTEDGVTKFNPNGTITYQDFLTICVRLYYSAINDAETITALNAGYPWSYVNRATALDITDGVVDVIANGTAITRGIAAKVVYNTLFAAELTTGDYDVLAEKYFGADVIKGTVVLTGIDGYQLTEQPLPEVGGYATVAVINEDGTLEPVPALRVPVEALLGDLADEAYNYIGASFDVITIDGFKTISNSTMNTRTVVTDADAIANLLINKVKYTLVSAYSFPIIADGNNWYGQTELILKDLENGFETITDAAALKPFTKGEVTYAPKYAELVGYDDNDDGVMDRAFYASFAVGTLGITTEKELCRTNWGSYVDEYFELYFDLNGDGANNMVYTMNAGAFGPAAPIPTTSDAWGSEYAIAFNADNRANAKDGDLVLYYYNPVANMFVIDKAYTVNTGVVTNYDFANDTVTIMDTSASADKWADNYGKGTAYSYAGIFNLEGANDTALILGEQGETAIYEALNQQVKYVLDGDAIIAFYGNTPADDYYIFDKIVRIDANGFINVQVMNAEGLYETLVINTVDSLPSWNFAEVLNTFEQGDIVRIVSDDITGRLNLLKANLDTAELFAYLGTDVEDVKSGDGLVRYLGKWWKDEATAQKYWKELNNWRSLSADLLIVEHPVMGLTVINLADAQDYAKLTINDGTCYEIADRVLYYPMVEGEAQVPVTLSNWQNSADKALTELFWSTNGVSTGNVWDIVYFDGTHNGLATTANKNEMVYTYVGNSDNWGGFNSLVKAQDEDITYNVKSFFKTVKAGFYTLITDVNGDVWFGTEIDPDDLPVVEMTVAEFNTAYASYNKLVGLGTTARSAYNEKAYFGLGDYDILDRDATKIKVVDFGDVDSIFYVDHGIVDVSEGNHANSQKAIAWVVGKANVTINEGTAPEIYDATVGTITNGTVTLNKTEGKKDTEIKLTVTAASGYTAGRMYYVDGNGNEVTINSKKFKMPASDVIVYVEFNKLYTITVPELNAPVNGTVTANKATAIEGTEITLTVEAKDGYVVDAVTVTDANGAAVTVTGNKFTMPASNVTVTATFVAAP